MHHVCIYFQWTIISMSENAKHEPIMRPMYVDMLLNEMYSECTMLWKKVQTSVWFVSAINATKNGWTYRYIKNKVFVIFWKQY